MEKTSKLNRRHTLREDTRILWAITANDLLAALKNKNALTAILLALVMVMVYRFLPNLTSGAEPQNLLIYDAGGSVLVPLLENSEVFRVNTYPSEEKLKQYLANGDVPEIGLVVPAGFDQALEADQAVGLQGYVMNWVSPANAAGQKRLVETEISRLTGRTVDVKVEGNIVYPRPDSHGLSVTVGVSLIYVILMTALPMLPHLFLEEKQSRTMDALLVSPASARQIVAGKAISGLFYCLVGAAVGLVVYWNAIVHWWLIILSILCGSLLTVAIGLWSGIRIENRGQLSMLISILIIPLLLPIFLYLMEDLFPAVLGQVCRLVPTTALFTLFRLSTVGDLPWETVLPSLAWVIAWAIGILALVTLQVRRLDRQDEKALTQPVDSYTAQPGLPRHTVLARFLPWLVGEWRAKPARGLPTRPPAVSPIDKTVVAPEVRENIPQPGWRITWAIASKDIREAIRNKIFLSLLLGTAFMAGSNSLFPLLLQGQAKPVLVVYDEGHSTLLRGLAGREDFRLSIQETRQGMENQVSGGGGSALGLVLPAEFDQKAGSAQEILLQGYISHAADQAKARQWAAFFEQELSQASWSTVRIQLDGNLLYPSLDVFGFPAMIAEVLAIILFTIGAALVPLLFIEEKEAHTLDALLVSPAGFAQVVAGKALAGGAYCLVAAVVLIGVNQRFFVHWEAVLMGVLLTTFFAVSVGLLVGILSNNPATAGIWGSLLLVFLITLTVLALVELPGWPLFLKQALSWLPGPAALNLFRISMAGEAPAAMLWTNAGALLSAVLLTYGLVIWRINRVDR